MKRFIEHEKHVDIEEYIKEFDVWAVTSCNIVLGGDGKNEKNVSKAQKVRDAVKRYYYKNRERVLEKQKNNVHKKYKISKETLDAMKEKQKGKCAICNKEKELVIDHDHRSGKVRGLLCNSCNVGIGLLQDSAEILEIAKAYISNTLI